jgi:hypothetical protein
MRENMRSILDYDKYWEKHGEELSNKLKPLKDWIKEIREKESLNTNNL